MTDIGLAPYAPPSELNAVGSSAAALLARGDLVAAFETALVVYLISFPLSKLIVSRTAWHGKAPSITPSAFSAVR